MNNKGTILFETLFAVELLVVTLFLGHLAVIKCWKQRLETLQSERLSYDGQKVMISGGEWDE